MTGSEAADRSQVIADAISLACERSGRPLQVLVVGCFPSVFRSIPAHGRWRAIIDSIPMPKPLVEDPRCRAVCELLTGRPSSVAVLDTDPRRLARASRQFRDQVVAITADLGVANPPELRPLRSSFDVVIALDAFRRLKDETRRKAAAWNLASLTAEDGLIVEDTGLVAGLANVSLAKKPCIFRRRAEATSLAQRRRHG